MEVQDNTAQNNAAQNDTNTDNADSYGRQLLGEGYTERPGRFRIRRELISGEEHHYDLAADIFEADDEAITAQAITALMDTLIEDFICPGCQVKVPVGRVTLVQPDGTVLFDINASYEK